MTVFVVTLLLSAPAHAQLFRSYLAPTGSDANPCTLLAPCRLLPAALAAVADGGEIWILESANYNTAPVNITKSVTILAVPGALGSVLAMAGDAIDIATAGVKVALRNLVIVPLPGSLAADVEASVKERLQGQRKELLTERKKLPGQIAALSVEGKRLLDTMADVSGVARRLADERLQGLGDELGRCEARLATVERELATLERTALESSWVARCLNDFTTIWDVLTPENRGRLLRAVVQRVDVDEPANQMKVFMVDLCVELPAPVDTATEEVTA